MGLLDNLTGLLAQYTGGATPAGDAGAHFQEVAKSLDSGTLAQGISAAMRSDQTAPFAQLVSQLFSADQGEQKMAMLNTLLSAVGPEQRAQIAGLIPGLASARSVSPEQAAAVPPSAVRISPSMWNSTMRASSTKMSALYAASPRS